MSTLDLKPGIPKPVTIALDAMGGDYAPGEMVQGAVDALSAYPHVHVLLVGKEALLRQELNKHKNWEKGITIVNATEVIATEETPTAAIRQKKDSSMVVGLNLVKEGKAQGFVSSGNTGALLTGATMIVGRIPGIARPALGAPMPYEKGATLLIDCGANVDAKPSYLVQFGQMGAVYMETVLGVPNPTVGLLNIGAEAEKGNALTKEAFPLMAEAIPNFVGNVEARELPKGATHVVVCDAFTGNVVLKYTEGIVPSFMGMIKTELMATTKAKIGAFLAKGAFKNLKQRFAYEDIGGAPFLGLNALVVKAHGNAKARAIKGAIGQCVKYNENDFVARLKEKLGE